MSAEIILSASALRSLRAGATVVADSTDGKIVNLSTMPYPQDGRYQVVLSPADLDLITTDPAGLVVPAEGMPLGWTVRTETPA